jgi:hypothetical protein
MGPEPLVGCLYDPDMLVAEYVVVNNVLKTLHNFQEDIHRSRLRAE